MTPSYAPVPAGPTGGRREATFAGASVFLSRNLVAPEVFDAVHDALRLNGAEVFLCADSGRTGPLDFHVISSSSHEKFADLKAKGCNLLGPQCILSCAKERRFLPKQSYTCCLAMDGVKIICSGFEKAEKAKIGEIVTAMGGLFQNNSSTDVNFIIVKDVMAAKYKWAVDTLKKPVVTMNWLEQCWIEHRVVPHEPYRILPFTGLNICVTGLNQDERKELQKIVLQNGGQFSTSLTRKCTHLVANDKTDECKIDYLKLLWLQGNITDSSVEPGGDKYVMAKKWGNIYIVNPRWVEQCVARRACIDEHSYLICQKASALSGIKGSLKKLHNPEISSASASFQPVPTTSVDDSVSTSQFVPASLGDAAKNNNTDIVGVSSVQETNQMQVNYHVAEDSEAENDDLYLSNCRISLVGFDEKEMLRLVRVIRDGGGSRHILLSEKLTHIVLGAPSEEEKREVRRLASWGVINVVKVTWLEDCSKSKKEVKVSPIHVVTDLVLKEFSHMSMEKSADTRETKVAKSSCGIFHVPTVNDSHGKELEKDMSSERKPERDKHDNMNKTRAARSAKSGQQNGMFSIGEYHPSAQVTSEMNSGSSKSSNIFKGKTFGFSNSFPHNKKPEVVDWVRDGGGTIMDNTESTHVDFMIECHGRSSIPCDFPFSTVVSTQWIRSCLEEGHMQDVRDHPIFSPLCCRIPFPGFGNFRFCISQYEAKERFLLKNLCFTLGAKFTEKASKIVTHLICKFANGPKYEVYSKRGTPTITAEWLFECVKQDTIVPFDDFQPKPCTSQDKDAGLCTVSQYSQGVRFGCSEPLSGCQVTTSNPTHKSGIAAANEETSATTVNKKRRLSVPSNAGDTRKNIGRTNRQLDSSSVPDVADAIEVLSSKDTIVPFDDFQPKSWTSQDKGAGLCTVSQYSQGVGFDCSEPLSGCQVTTSKPTHKSGVAAANEEASAPTVNKRRLSVPSKAGDARESIGRTDRQLDSSSVPDFADAIEVLSSKIQDVQSPRTSPRTNFEPDDPVIVTKQIDTQSIGNLKNWLNMQQKQDNTPGTKVQNLNSSPTPPPVPAPYYPFSETQTESQIVGYEEDLTGMQKIIDRVRSQGSNSTNVTPEGFS